MNAITKRKALNEVFKQFQCLPEWPTEKDHEPTQLEPQSPPGYLKTRHARRQITSVLSEKGTISRS
jgi:hypothetical protein